MRRAPRPMAEAVPSMVVERGRLPPASTGIEREHALARMRVEQAAEAREREAEERFAPGGGAIGGTASVSRAPQSTRKSAERARGLVAADSDVYPVDAYREQGRDRFASARSKPRQGGGRGAGVDVLDRRRHRLLRFRPRLAERRGAAAEGRGAGRGARQLLPLRLPRPREPRDAVRGERIAHADSVERFHAADAHRHPGLRPRHGDRAACEPRLPRRRVRVDGRTGQAPPCRQLSQAPPRHPSPPRTRSRSWSTRARPAPCSRRPRWPSGGGSSLPSNTWTRAVRRPAARGSGRPTSSPSGTSWKVGSTGVILATDGDFNVGITDSDELEGFIARKRESGVFLSVLGYGMGNYNDGADAAPRPERERQRRLHRQPERSAEGPRRGSHLDALPHREGREDPGRVQPGRGERVPAHRLRDADARPRGLPQRPGGRGRDRLRPHRHRDLRSGAGRVGGRAGRAASLPARGKRRRRRPSSPTSLPSSRSATSARTPTPASSSPAR